MMTKKVQNITKIWAGMSQKNIFSVFRFAVKVAVTRF